MHPRRMLFTIFTQLALVASCAVDEPPTVSSESDAPRGAAVFAEGGRPEQSIALFDVTIDDHEGAQLVTGFVGDALVSVRVDEVRSLDNEPMTALAPAVHDKRQASEEETTRTTCDCWECGTKKKPKQCCICSP